MPVGGIDSNVIARIGMAHDSTVVMKTHPGAPLAVLSSALRMGQSEMASLPSSIDSVSRVGLATDPPSIWSLPTTSGAETSRPTHNARDVPGASLSLVSQSSPIRGGLLGLRAFEDHGCD